MWPIFFDKRKNEQTNIRSSVMLHIKMYYKAIYAT